MSLIGSPIAFDLARTPLPMRTGAGEIEGPRAGG